MDLDLTPEQELLRETVRGLCARHCGLDVVRAMEDDPVGYPEKFWLQLAELGLLDMNDLTVLDAVILYTELGRALAPSPHFASSVVSVGDPAFADYTDSAQLPAHVFREMRRFFEDYKALEHKATIVEDLLGPREALEIVSDALDLYRRRRPELV